MSHNNDGPPDAGFCGSQFGELLSKLGQTPGELETTNDWPGSQFRLLAEAGVLGWVIPEAFGGTDISAEELTYGYEQLAAACLVTTFVLTQRNGACQRIAGSDNDDLKAELLPKLCSGEAFATVGISHLTTSRQHLRKPAVEVRQSSSGLVFDGTVPWVTGAKPADYIVTGGTCEDGRQVLAVIPTSLDGVRVLEPAEMLALNASQTGPVKLDAVELDERYLLAGPVENVMKKGTGGGTGSLATSALALGAAEASLRRFHAEVENRPDLVEIYEPLAADRSEISADMYAAVRGESPEENPSVSTESIRRRANSLVLRSTQAYLGATKGAGFVKGHPAERAVREAMFFLVWSCPQPVLSAALREFACLVDS